MATYLSIMPKGATSRGRNSGGAALRVLTFFAILIGLASLIYLVARSFTVTRFSPIGLFDAPVFVKSNGVDDRVIMLTGQWQRMRPPGRSSVTFEYTVFHVDLWAIDATTAKPLWRKRLETERGGGFVDRSLLGVDRGTVWLFMKGELVALSAVDGSVIAPAGRVESENPELQGLMPNESRYYQFDARGLHIRAADARGWRMDPATFKVLPDTGPATPIEGAFPPEFITPGSSGLHLVRGLDVPEHWLGLLTEEEATYFEEHNEVGDLTREIRRRLWGAKAVKATNFFGEYLDYTELKPLPESPEFLDAGLLREYYEGHQMPALWAREPDSVFVLHRDRLGEAGKLRLARVAGPKGNVIWEASLPLTYVQSVKRMESVILILGKEFIAGDPDITDALRDSPQRLVAIEIASGAVQVWSFSALDTHPAAVKVDVGL